MVRDPRWPPKREVWISSSRRLLPTPASPSIRMQPPLRCVTNCSITSLICANVHSRTSQGQLLAVAQNAHWICFATPAAAVLCHREQEDVNVGTPGLVGGRLQWSSANVTPLRTQYSLVDETLGTWGWLRNFYLGAHALCAYDGLQVPGGHYRWWGGISAVGMPCILGVALRPLSRYHRLRRRARLHQARHAEHFHGECLALHLHTRNSPRLFPCSSSLVSYKAVLCLPSLSALDLASRSLSH